jgi:hypothetical protein
MRNEHKELVESLFAAGRSARILLDPRADGVTVPPEHSFKNELVLEFGLELPLPIHDIRVDDFGISGTLSFRGVGFTCYVPWEGVKQVGLGPVYRRPKLRLIKGGKV